MFQQQVRVINNFLMILDALAILLGGYVAYILRRFLSEGRWNIKIELFLFSVGLVIMVNNYIMGRIGLYSDRRPTSYFHILISVFKAMVIDFLILGAAIFMFKITYYSRAFFMFFASFSYLFIIIERFLVQIYLDKFARKRLHARNLIVVGNEKRGKIVAEALEKQLSLGT